MYQEQVPSYKHLDELLDEGRFCILNVFWQGTSKRCSWPLNCTLHLFCLTFSWKSAVSCYKINCSLHVTPTSGGVQGFAESLQHYTKMHKAKYAAADRSIHGAQVRLQYVLLITLPAANYNLSLLKRLNLGL